jgi:hypothetical protein
MISKLKRHIGRYINNISGWSTDRKIVVIESDDWGSIRMPSKEVYEECLKAGYQVDQNVYERFDSLASEDDLELLFDVLYSVSDQWGKPAVMTANILTANPDFERIKASGYRKYYYESIARTFEKYPNHSNALNLWKRGKDNGVFYPQSHGREHLNVSLFMNALQQGDEDVLFGFKHNMPGNISKYNTKVGNKFVESMRYTNQQDKEEKLSFVIEGLDLFEDLMGYRSETFIPPNYIWSPDFDELMSRKGVRFYQGHRKMKEPLFNGTIRLHKHRLGEENNFGQKYLIRNAIFEPSMSSTNEDPVKRCLRDISAAIRMNKPAVICSHRLNYVGYIDVENRDKNLEMLEELLIQITKKWPQVEFLNSEQLGRIMEK